MDKWFDAGSKIGNGLVDPTTGATLGTGGGLKVTKIKEGIIRQNTNMQEGFVIIGINNKAVSKKEDLEALVNESKGNGILIQGKYPDQNGLKYYAFGY